MYKYFEIAMRIKDSKKLEVVDADLTDAISRFKKYVS